MDGILNINKPRGMTSFGVVNTVKRLSGQHRVGHAGTLDPMASGVLPVCLGQGTRIVEFLMDATKAYLADVELGSATDTYDADGKVVQIEDFSGISREQLESALASFVGIIEQIPPMYSAVKHRGKPLYELARAGITVARKTRKAQVYHLQLLSWQPPIVAIEVVCSKGTYIRSLAHNLGQALGCGAHLKRLIRSRCGPFCVHEAVSISQLEHAFRCGYWRSLIYPIDFVLLHWPAMIVNETAEQAIRTGRSLLFDNGDKKTKGVEQDSLAVHSENLCRAYTFDGDFLCVLRFNHEKGMWHPRKVFRSAEPAQ